MNSFPVPHLTCLGAIKNLIALGTTQLRAVGLACRAARHPANLSLGRNMTGTSRMRRPGAESLESREPTRSRECLRKAWKTGHKAVCQWRQNRKEMFESLLGASDAQFCGHHQCRKEELSLFGQSRRASKASCRVKFFYFPFKKFSENRELRSLLPGRRREQ